MAEVVPLQNSVCPSISLSQQLRSACQRVFKHVVSVERRVHRLGVHTMLPVRPVEEKQFTQAPKLPTLRCFAYSLLMCQAAMGDSVAPSTLALACPGT